MPSKSRTSQMPMPLTARLDAFGFILISGTDAADYLQRQTMNDVRDLRQAGHWHWNGVLSPKGRVLSLFALLRTGETDFLLIHPDGEASMLAAMLKRTVFRSKLSIATCDNHHALGFLGAHPLPSATHPALAQPFADGWLLDTGSPGRPRQLWVGSTPGPAISDLGGGATAEACQAWLAEDLRHGLVHLGPDWRDAYTPQMLALERLAAFSVKKGCYPGQEIVARTHFLGAAKRQLAMVEGTSPFATGELLRRDEVETPVLMHASDGDEHIALAVVPVGDRDDWGRADGTHAARTPFVEGLARTPA
jgi:tRNA-modifying protein YgfZ